MKKKILKIAALTAAVALILGVLIFANSLVGNPLSRALAKSTAEKHIANNYAGTDYELVEVEYNLKDGSYHATVASPTSRDTEFTLFINGFGKLQYDNYDFLVESGWSTAMRIDKDYRALVESLVESASFPYDAYIAYGELAFVTEEHEGNTTVPSYAILTEGLTPDAYYNVSEFGARAGKLTVLIDDTTVSAERMADILLGIRDSFDKAGVGFYAIDCVLEYTRDADGTAEDGRVEVVEFLYSDIYEEDLVERVEAANSAASAYAGMN